MAVHPRILLKVVVVGNYGVGKTTLIESIKKGAFSDTVANAADLHGFETQYEQSDYSIAYWDKQYRGERMQPAPYNQTDAILLCYSADSPTSFENILVRWVPELEHHCPKVPKVLMCTKTDLRNDEAVISELTAQFGRGPIETEESIERAKHIGATLYLESSAKHMVGLSTLHAI